MNLTQETLKKFGLKENEIKVYLEVLKSEELTPFQISKATKVPRTTVYDVLLGLSLKGLVELEQSDGFTKQQTLVRAKDPSVLRRVLSDKRRDLFALELDILEVLPDLKKGFHQTKTNADFQFYPGVEGAKRVYFDDFWEDLEVPLFEWDLLMPMDAFGMDAVNKDVEKQLETLKKKKPLDKTIVPLNDWTRHVLTYQVGRDPTYLEAYNINYIEDSAFEIYVQFQIRGDYIKAVCSREEEIWGLRMKSKMLSKTFKSIFDQTWKTSTKVTMDMVKSWGSNLLLEEEKKRKD